MGNRLLLADDSITIQKVVGIIFANEDFELTVVDNGDAALEKARESRPDVMLIDALMPGSNGYEVCAAVRHDPALKNTPLLLMTGAFEPFDEERARQCGADDFISKPFESQQLVDKVKELLALGSSRAVTGAGATPDFAAESPPAAFEVEPEPFVSPPEPSAVFESAFPEPFPTFESEPLAEPAGAPASQAVTFEAEEAAPADDLWGAFELEEEVAGEVEVGEMVTGDEAMTEVFDAAAFAATPAASADSGTFGVPVEEFTFTEEPASGAVEETISFGAVAEPESFTFEPEPTAGAPAAEAFAGEPVTGFEFGGAAVPAQFVVEQQFAPEEEYVPAAAPAASTVAVPAVEPVAPGAGTITLSEEQLAAAISRISREVIERIAWEVVPDLAETIIKEEIRKIKEGL
ncbi:response regulator [Geobacter anodireducens]|uniref:Response regulator n=1 Tax=Geobacter anodireducens TaxID=1340425 RepID=A0ABR9NRF4_9BACT|nr:response regulator [Geobacter anodireducens]MBE2886830.1 response regulator [Geobacter anodireducens]